MAIREHDREDLLAEGRNMPWRGEVAIESTPVVIGFRSGGQASLYCGVDPVFQFNAAIELRRAYFQSTRYRAERGRLIQMIRQSKGGQVRFESQPAQAIRQNEILDSLHRWLGHLVAIAESSKWRVEGESVPCFQARLQRWMSRVPQPIRIAAAANA